MLEQPTRELTVEALPNDIPDSLQHDVSEMVIGDTLTLDAVSAPASVKLLDDPETVIATLTPPRLQVEEEPGIEEETELVGEGEGEAVPRRRQRRRRLFRRRRRQRRRVGPARAGCRLAGRRARQPGLRVRGHPPQHRLRDRQRARRPLGAAEGEVEVPRAPDRRPAGPGGPRVAILLPQTYMNDAGDSVGPARGALNVPLDHVLVLHDEIDLPFGEIRDPRRRRARRATTG